MKNSKAGPKPSGGASQKPDPKLGQDVQAKIGRQLRAIYDDVVNQGVPERFIELLDRLDKEQGGKTES